MKVKLPTYVNTDRVDRTSTCSICGALVTNFERHDSWHAALARVLGLDAEGGRL